MLKKTKNINDLEKNILNFYEVLKKDCIQNPHLLLHMTIVEYYILDFFEEEKEEVKKENEVKI